MHSPALYSSSSSSLRIGRNPKSHEGKVVCAMVGSIYVQIARTSRSHATSGLTLAGKDTSYDRSREDTSRRVVRRACANRGDERTSNRQSHRTHTPCPSDVTSHPTSPCTTGRARPRVRRLRPDRFEKNKSTSRKARKGALTFRTLLCPQKVNFPTFCRPRRRAVGRNVF